MKPSKFRSVVDDVIGGVVPNDSVAWHTMIAESFSSKYRTKPAFIERMSVWSRLIKLHFSANDHVLDLGCGSGEFSLIASTTCKHVIGVDGSLKMLGIGKLEANRLAIKNVTFQYADLNHQDLSTISPADGILLSSVLEYLEDPLAFMKNVELLMLPGSRIILSVPNRSSIYRMIESISYRFFRFPRYRRYVKTILTLEEMTGIFEAINLTVIESQYYGKAPFIGSFLRKLGLNRFSDTLIVIVAEHRGVS